MTTNPIFSKIGQRQERSVAEAPLSATSQAARHRSDAEKSGVDSL